MRWRAAIPLLVVLLSSTRCAEVLDFAVHQHVDDACRAAVHHLEDCCPNFKGGAIVCSYDDRGSLGGRAEVSGSQASCIERTSCAAVRTAAASYDDVCGYEMRRNLLKDGGCDKNSIPLKGVKKPSEKDD